MAVKRGRKGILKNTNKYNCISEACRMFGLKRTTVSEAIRLGGESPSEAFINALERRYNICVQ